jgi:DNA polymerase III delta prime subunit
VPLKLEDVRDRYATTGSQWLKLMIAGPPGVGKTLFASTFPHVCYADAEGRLLSVRKRKVKAVTITSIGVLDELRAALAQSPEVREKVLGAPVDTIVLDTVDEIARLIIKERLKAEKRETMAMADWGYLGDTLRSMLRGFRNLPLHVLLNVHLKSSEDSETGRVHWKPSIQGSVGDEIAAYVDESFLMVARPMTDPKTGDRVISRHLQTYPDAQHDWVKDHSGTLPQEFPVDFLTDYERLSQLIFGDVPAPVPASQHPSPAPPPQAPLAKAPATRRPSPATAPSPAMGSPAPQPDAIAAPAQDDGGNGAVVVLETSDKVPCTDCGASLDPTADEQQIAHSTARWKVPLCRDCYVNRKNAKSTAAN